MPATEDILRAKPSRFRSPVSRGITPDAGDPKSSGPAIDAAGGDAQAGVIRGLSVVAAGEALGHGVWLDQTFLGQVVQAVQASGEKGVKARFTHPGLSADGLGSYLGRVKDARVDAGSVRADLHLSPSAHETPDGDLAAYVMRLAQDDPAAFGASIVFTADPDAEEAFLLEHGATRRPDGRLDASGFASPDPRNLKHLPHARLAALHACDVVDEPAANPDGLFQRRGADLASDADALMAYAVGLAPRPALVALDIDPDRARAAVARFLHNHGLALKPQEKSAMPDPLPDTKLAATPPAQAPEPAAPPAATPLSTDRANEGKRFIELFGPLGATWFAEGRSFEEAKDLFIASLRTENTDLKGRLAAVDRGEPAPVSHAAGASGASGGAGDPAKESKQRRAAAALGTGLGAFAAGLRFAPPTE